MKQTSTLLAKLATEASDLRINLERVLAGESLSKELTWGVAIASACYIRHPDLAAAIQADAESEGVPAAIVEDARAAASIMGMNTVYYRFLHLMKSDAYKKLPVNLRMTRMSQVATTKGNFELFSIGPAALSGCELCLKLHEAAVKKEGMTEQNIQDAVRIASVLQGLAVGLDLPA